MRFIKRKEKKRPDSKSLIGSPFGPSLSTAAGIFEFGLMSTKPEVN
jgi:hypothetical protein